MIEEFMAGCDAFGRIDPKEEEILSCLYKNERCSFKELQEKTNLTRSFLDMRFKHLENLRMVFTRGYPKEYLVTSEIKDIFDNIASEKIEWGAIEYYHLTGEVGYLNEPEMKAIRALEKYGKLLIKKGVYF